MKKVSQYSLPELGYSFYSLEPFIDEETMELHYDKHHRNYLNNLNLSLSKYTNIQHDLQTLLKNPILIPEDIRISVKNNGGGYLNHSFFWKILKKSNNNEEELSENLKELINKYFNNLKNFKDYFSDKAQKIFGCGWVWLMIDFDNQLKIVSTMNQDTVLNIGYPIIGLDLWEHAYYLSYKNRRKDYIEAFFNIINWKQASENLDNGLIKNIKKKY
ncbi:superoxide dismutase [Candidatus Phytoplasma sacchari]|uniref:Superoxide dismutase n=1 Tax=Candidatus Phytoplasma sacchari TaxID=2609813 RepID=A0ABY7M2T4_9MOLU|nr:superoxide dismutase [Candidatus Phytoplasma sacchari]